MTYLESSVDAGIGTIQFQSRAPALDNPDLRKDLKAVLQTLSDLKGLKAVFLRGPDGGLTSLTRQDHTEQLKNGVPFTDILCQLDQYPVPITILLSGGIRDSLADLALAAHYRLGDMNLNIEFSAWKRRHLQPHGTTQRLPRIIGAKRGLDMLLGKSVTAREAVEIGLVDGLARHSLIKSTPTFFAKRIADNPVPRTAFNRTISATSAAAFQDQIVAAKANTRNPLVRRVVDCVEASHMLPPLVALDFEAAILSEFDDIPGYKPLAYARDTLMRYRPISTLPSPSVCILGATEQAIRWLRVCCRHGIDAALFVPRADQLERVQTVWRKRMPKAANTRFENAVISTDRKYLRAQLVIDTHSYSAAVPTGAVKQFSGASDTASTYAFLSGHHDIAVLQTLTNGRATVGLNLSSDNGLVELRGAPSDAVSAFCAALGLPLIATQSQRQTIAETLQDAFVYGAEVMMTKGYTPTQIETAFKASGWKQGPISFIMKSGVKSHANRQDIYQSQLPQTSLKPVILKQVLNATGGAKCDLFDDDVALVLAKISDIADANSDSDRIYPTMLATVTHAAGRILSDDPALDPQAVDLVSRHALGVPYALGGILCAAEQIGLSTLNDILNDTGNAAFAPTKSLRQAVKSGVFKRSA